MSLRILGVVAALSLGLLAAPLTAGAQQATKVWRIGWLGSESPATGGPFIEAVLHGLRELGYVEGQNISVERRWAHGKVEALPRLAAELVRLDSDVLFAGTTHATLAAWNATKTTPVIFAGIPDPIGAGLVTSLARPGGNVTGLSSASLELVPKRLQLLHEVSGGKLWRVAVVFNPDEPSNVAALRSLQGPAQTLGIALRPVVVRRPQDFDDAFSQLRSARVDALFVVTSPLTNTHATRIVHLVTRTRLPAIYGQRRYVDAGGLISYTADLLDQFRRAAVYIDRVLKGAKPADLPVEQPTKFELVVNLKAASALGMIIPPSVLGRADQVIE